MKNTVKTAIVIGSNIHWAPYYKRYEKILNEKNIQFDLIIWNREGLEEKVNANTIIEYKIKDVSDNKNPWKIVKFIGFSRFVKKVLKENEYEKIIFLGTHGCAPVFLANFLNKKYKRKYWLDIRDYQYEWFKPFFLLEKKSIKNSYVTTISSKGYEQFLPQHDYLYMHNIDPNMNDLKKQYKKNKEEGKIRISFIGNVRYYEENIKLVNLFANDNRFVLQYYGAGSDIIQKYCDDKKIKNVRFHGLFKATDTVKFYNNTDIINNVYGNNKLGLTTALSNKLYYSVNFNIPILVSANTYMEEITVKNNFGFIIEYEPSFPDRLIEQYNKYKENLQCSQYENVWKKIKEDDETTINRLIEFLK